MQGCIQPRVMCRMLCCGAVPFAGSVPQLPKFTPSKVRQVVENEARPYQDLAQAYASHNSERLRKTREHHLQTYNNVSGGCSTCVLVVWE